MCPYGVYRKLPYRTYAVARYGCLENEHLPWPPAVQFLKRPVIYPENICEQSLVILIFRPASTISNFMAGMELLPRRRRIAMTDIYSWVLSPEIRDYLRTARPLTTEEKAEIPPPHRQNAPVPHIDRRNIFRRKLL